MMQATGTWYRSLFPLCSWQTSGTTSARFDFRCYFGFYVLYYDFYIYIFSVLALLIVLTYVFMLIFLQACSCSFFLLSCNKTAEAFFQQQHD